MGGVKNDMKIETPPKADVDNSLRNLNNSDIIQKLYSVIVLLFTQNISKFLAALAPRIYLLSCF